MKHLVGSKFLGSFTTGRPENGFKLPNVTNTQPLCTTLIKDDTMTSKFRILSILFSLVMLIGFGWISYILDSQALIHNGFPDIVTSIVCLVVNLIFLAGIIALVVIPKTIHFDKEKLIVNYLFRPKKLECNIDEIEGFRWDYLYAAINYKRIVLYHKNGKTIKFSDYEYGNFYDLETYIKNHIPVFKSMTAKPTDEEVKQAFQYSDYLDIQQITQIKMAIYITWVGTIFILKTLVDHIENLELSRTTTGLIWMLFVIWTFRKHKMENARKTKIESGA